MGMVKKFVDLIGGGSSEKGPAVSVLIHSSWWLYKLP